MIKDLYPQAQQPRYWLLPYACKLGHLSWARGGFTLSVAMLGYASQFHNASDYNEGILLYGVYCYPPSASSVSF